MASKVRRSLFWKVALYYGVLIVTPGSTDYQMEV